MSRTICITPLDHLGGLKESFEHDYFPNVSKRELRNLLLKNKYKIIFTNPNKQNFKLDSSVLKNTTVKIINTASTGLNHIDLKYCEREEIEIWSLKEDYKLIRDLPSTAELGFGLAISMIRKIPQSFDDVKSGNWDYEPFVGRQLQGMTAGIIGYGRLGTFMAKYCNAFGMKVVVCDPNKNIFDHEQVEISELYQRSDVIFLHVHVTHDTIEMINGDSIRQMKKKPYIVNTSRGEIVNEDDILVSLKNGKISGYGTDVLAKEFQSDVSRSQLIKESKKGVYNIIITPHIGGMSMEGQYMAYKHAISKFSTTV